MAVIVAEEITGRFLNVIALFNGYIPLIAIQMHALRIGDNISLAFSTVLSEVRLGPVEDDEIVEVTDRAYWDNRASRFSMVLADTLLNVVRTIDPTLTLKYNKHYVGLARNGLPPKVTYEWNSAVRYVRTSNMPQKRKPAWASETTYKRHMPCGRLALRAYCPYGGVVWQRQWEEPAVGRLSKKFKTIARELQAAVPEIVRLRDEAEARAEAERQRWEAERREREWKSGSVVAQKR